MTIHPTAVVDSRARIDEGVEIGPFCIIGEGAKISRGARLASHVVIEGDTEIGPDCTIHHFASIGLPPQDLKYKGEKTGVKIGRNNIIREYVSVHRGSVGGTGFTTIGDNNFLMAYVHIAHDCNVGSGVIMANCATLGGHEEVHDNAIIGGLVAVHQFVRIGAYSMVGGFSGIGLDVPPYTTASGPRAKLFGLNLIGLKRSGFPKETLGELNQAYKILFRSRHTLKEALKKIQEDLPYTPELGRLIEFVKGSNRGIMRPTASKTAEF
jgi:UDP-N-acetylglucosamine acyltransferase